MSNKEHYIADHVETSTKRLIALDEVKEALAFLKEDNERTANEQIEITAVPAPTFSEETRGQFYKKKLEALGLETIEVDEVGNIFGIRRGVGDGPRLVVSAHLDTVFPDGTDTVAKWKDGRIYAPGISDDGRGLAVVLTLIRALKASKVETTGDILFGVTVGEEGLGDLRGVKALFKNRQDIDGFISVEPGSPTETTYLATGSLRYRVTYTGRGGHSFGDFGTPSAIHAMGRAIAMISDLETSSDPKTTFNVGTVSGGTSVNTIAQEAVMVIDLRSTSQEELLVLDKRVLEVLQQAADAENRRWESDSIKVKIEAVGNRPAGQQPADAVIVQAALAATKAIGFEPELDPPSSTDSNVPISLGIPAVTLGGGGDCGGIHTLDEYFDPTDAYYGPQRILLTILSLVGVSGKVSPLL
ncbi:M20/M25/M40 family metallo-hydrolase [Pullulanibacillus sp. KACC 23026]|uniref:M20/M25/M40 family metallo-hydrolase n=1 Tax=Pullulanibacillus sp. KACC 23026 TaxID=3028315 RepID=UPI0023AF5179|nr:M20/M25/M40 family metallo-hydrolase [Pullulanibacillus sp. KACC 23026]WEG13563.1 M20/M25/M40 family metallo-hydrolase [Pullulanibacillus sp. KACC 23026]